MGAAIVTRVAATLPAWVTGRVAFVADSWGRLDAGTRAELDARAARAGAAATARVVTDLRALFATPVAEQRATPLQIVRSATVDVTAVLRAAGVPPVERDAFDEQAFPDDEFGVTPASLAELGDEALGPLQLAWGFAKARALRGGAPGA